MPFCLGKRFSDETWFELFTWMCYNAYGKGWLAANYFKNRRFFGKNKEIPLQLDITML